MKLRELKIGSSYIITVEDRINLRSIWSSDFVDHLLTNPIVKVEDISQNKVKLYINGYIHPRQPVNLNNDGINYISFREVCLKKLTLQDIL